MALYLGYYRPAPGMAEAAAQRARTGEGGPDPAMRQKVLGLPEALPDGCRLLGSYAPIPGSPDNPPGMMLVETDNTNDLAAISMHYQGFLSVQSVPGIAIGANRQERDAWGARTAVRA